MKLNSALKHQDFTNAEKWMINGRWLCEVMSKMKLQNNLLPLLFSRIVYMINSMVPLDKYRHKAMSVTAVEHGCDLNDNKLRSIQD